MQGKTVLFFDPDPRVCRSAERALNATRSEVQTVADRDAFLSAMRADDYDLVMGNCDSKDDAAELLAKEFAAHNKRAPATQFVLHVTGETEDYLPILARHPHIRNLIAKNADPLEPEELIVTAEKLLRRELFGLQKYLSWGVEPLSVEVSDSHDKRDYVGTLVDFADRLGCSRRMTDLVESIADELIMNAIFNAPRDEHGKPKYRDLHRSGHVVLEEHERATLQFACDGNYIAVSLLDPFGALTQDTLLSYLNRCLVRGPQQISDESGGAGLGLFRVFQSISKFVVNLQPGKKTEVIALIDLRLSMRQFRLAAKSFHFFVDGARE